MKIRTVSDPIEVILYTGKNAKKVARFLVEQGAPRVQLERTSEGYQLVDFDGVYPLGRLMGYGRPTAARWGKSIFTLDPKSVKGYVTLDGMAAHPREDEGVEEVFT